MYEDWFKTWWLVAAAAVSGAMCWIGFYHHNSPFALMFAGSMFYLVKGRRVERVEGGVLAISPSMFSVYLLHTNAYGFEMLRKVEDCLVASGWNYYAMAFIVAIGIFGMCVLLDMPRRAIGWIVRRKCSYPCRNM